MQAHPLQTWPPQRRRHGLSAGTAGFISPGNSDLAPLLRSLLGFVCFALLTLVSSASRGQDLGFTLDFEDGNLRGWQMSANRRNAFQSQPTLGDNPTARNRGQPSNHQGKYWIGTFESFQGRPGQKPGSVQGDAPQGTLTSPTFICPGGTLSFLIGGGAAFETRVELLLEDPIEGSIRVRTASGSNSETMRRESWDISEFVDRPMRIRIVDASSDGWGHINVDDFRFTGMVEVPPLRGREIRQARLILDKVGLTLGDVNYLEDGERANVIVRQSPAAGTTQPRGTRINVWATRGPAPTVEVPDVVDKEVRLAVRLIRDAKLVEGEIFREPSDAAEGTVIRQDPVAGTEVPMESSVTLWVAVPPPRPSPVTVPRVIDMPLEQAAEALKEVDLGVGNVTRQAADRPDDVVLEQKPEPGTPVDPGTRVDLLVAVSTVAVPDVLGRERPVAERIIQRAHLRVGEAVEEQSMAAAGTVIRQDPPSGTAAAWGDAVNIWIAVPPPQPAPVQVPPVTGKLLHEATESLVRHTLNVGEVRYESSNESDNIVLQQSPPAGRLVNAGSAVDLVVAKSAVAVPDLRGLSSGEARAAIRRSGLEVGFRSAGLSASRPGTVISQQPKPGKWVPPGSPVSFAVASWTVWAGTGIGGLLLLSAIGYFILRPSGGHISIPNVDTELHWDTGETGTDYGEGNPVVLDVSTRVVTDPGEADLDISGDAIASERRQNEDD